MNDTELLNELECFTNLFLWAYETNNADVMRKLLRLVEQKAKGCSGYKMLEKYWRRDQGLTENETKRLTENDIKCLEREMGSFANEILADWYSKSKEWLKNPTIETYPVLQELTKEAIKKVLSKRIGEDRSTISEYVLGEDGKEVSLLDQYDANKPYSQPPSPEDRNTERAIAEILEKEIKPIRRFCENIKIAGGIKIFPVVKELENYLISSYERKASESLDNILKSKSVYQIAKEKGTSFRKLLYVLKSINFPLSSRETGRYSNYITLKNLSLLETCWPLMEMMWEFEKNYKNWIKFFRDQYGWEKSRITNFMKRRIKDGIAPAYFFELPPPPSKEHLQMLFKKDKKLATGFAEIMHLLGDRSTGIPFKLHTKKEIKILLLKLTRAAQKTILTKE